VEGIVSAFQRAVNVLEADQFTQGLDHAVGLDAVAWLKKILFKLWSRGGQHFWRHGKIS
jgi:hypothetical protein